MENRASMRVHSNIPIDFYYNNEIYKATVKNLSRSGLYIDTNTRPPCESNIVVALILDDNSIKFRGKVKRTVYTNKISGIGVELLDPPQSYSAFVSRMKTIFPG